MAQNYTTTGGYFSYTCTKHSRHAQFFCVDTRIRMKVNNTEKTLYSFGKIYITLGLRYTEVFEVHKNDIICTFNLNENYGVMFIY